MSTTRLSVLLPCRDAAEHLPQAIRSLQLQTYHEFEVIAVDDGSRDGTGDVLERWADRDERVRVIRLGREGLPEALRAGSELCQGELLARADADDVVHPRRFAEQVKLLDSRADVSMTGTGVRYFPRDEVGWGARRYQRWLNKMSDPESLARDVFVECPIAHPTMMMRRAVFEDVELTVGPRITILSCDSMSLAGDWQTSRESSTYGGKAITGCHARIPDIPPIPSGSVRSTICAKVS